MRGRVVGAARSGMLVMVMAAVACSDSTAPTMESVAGDYQAAVLTVHYPTEVVDLLAGGGNLFLELGENGATGGELFIPGGEEDGTDLTASLAGSWSFREGKITLEHDADTFLRDIELEPVGNRLFGTLSQQSPSIFVLLDRAPAG